MLKNPSKIYKFSNLLFYPQESKISCSLTGNEVFLRQIVRDFLLVLVQKTHQTLCFEDFQNSVESWKDYRQINQLKRVIQATKGELINRIRQLENDFDLIEAVASKGYRLNAVVTELYVSQDGRPTILNKSSSIKGKSYVLDSCFFQSLFASVIYSLLHSVALFVEVAYQYKNFSGNIWFVSLLVFVWVLFTTLLTLIAIPKMASHWNDLKKSFLLCLVIFFVSAIILHFAIGKFLPDYPITETNFRSYPAHAAYLKSIIYFLPLGVFLLIFPINSIIWLQKFFCTRDKKANEDLTKYEDKDFVLRRFFFSAKLLLILIILAMLGSLIAMTHLFDNLLPNSNLNLFIQLVWLRWLLYFTLAIESLTWYWLKLNDCAVKID